MVVASSGVLFSYLCVAERVCAVLERGAEGDGVVVGIPDAGFPGMTAVCFRTACVSDTVCAAAHLGWGCCCSC